MSNKPFASTSVIPQIPIHNKHSIDSEDGFQTPTTVSNLHSRVVGFFKKSSVSSIEKDAFEKDLKEIPDIETFATLKEESYGSILPMIASWFKSFSNIRYGLIYIHEGLRLFPKVFAKRSSHQYLQQIIKCKFSFKFILYTIAT